MAALVTDVVRAFVFLWLLLTVPVVCHHETAVALLGALNTGHGQHHAGSAQVHQHAHHAVADADGLGAVQDPAPVSTSRPASPTPEWCAGHTAGATAGLPGGLDGFAFFGDLDLPAPTLGPAVAHAVVTATSAIRTPPAPPPRLLG